MPSDLPTEVGRSVDLFLAAADELAPGVVTGFYLVGSVALGDFHPRGRLGTASDIDFVAVTDRRLGRESRELAAVAEAHARTAARFRRPYFDGPVLTWADLAAGPDGCPTVPGAQDGRFTPDGRSGTDPVTFCELAEYGIAVRGPQPAELDVWADQDALRAFTRENLDTYWRPWWRRHRRRTPPSLAIGASAWFPVWAVLGVSRLHHLLATGTMTSKCGAGRYARTAFDARWLPIVEESLSLRTNGAAGRRCYRDPLTRRRDTLAFLDEAIESALELPAGGTRS